MENSGKIYFAQTDFRNERRKFGIKEEDRRKHIYVIGKTGMGKSTLLGMMARNTEAHVNVIALVGERGREVKEFIERDLGEEGLRKSVIIVATSDQPPVIRMMAPLLATAIAEYFRD